MYYMPAHKSPVTSANAASVRTPKTSTSLFQCLVVSDDSERCGMFSKALEQAGWKAVVCRDVDEARAEADRFRFQLVIVDLDGTGGPANEELRALAEELAAAGTALQMICGNEGNPLEEIWAMQHGAWLYLPGVDESCDVTLLCREAKQVAEKMNPELVERQVAAGITA